MSREICKKVIEKDEVIAIHEYVVDFFAEIDPVHPGINNEAALEMAIEKPFITGCPDRPKYFDEYTSAAALTYGLTKSHAFFDGNKRTSMVVLLAYLDALKMQMKASISQDDLYKFMIHLTTDRMHEMPRFKQIIANHDYFRMSRTRLKLPRNVMKVYKGASVAELGGDVNDTTIFFAALWLKSNTRKRVMRERPVTLRELKQILAKFGLELETADGNGYAVLASGAGRKEGPSRAGFAAGDGRCALVRASGGAGLVGVDQVKKLRRYCGLRSYGYDGFYGDRIPADTIIALNAKALRRLAEYDKNK